MIHKVSVHFMWALMLLVISLGAYGYEYSKVSAESTQAAMLASHIRDQSDAATKDALAKSELSQISVQEAAIGQYFVSTTDVVPFIEKIQAIGKFLGADVQVVSVSAQPASPYGSLNLSISITGSFDAVSRTIGAIEYEPYNTSITSLTMTSSGTAQGNSLPTSTASSSPVSTQPTWNAAVIFTVGAETSTATTTTS